LKSAKKELHVQKGNVWNVSRLNFVWKKDVMKEIFSVIMIAAAEMNSMKFAHRQKLVKTGSVLRVLLRNLVKPHSV